MPDDEGREGNPPAKGQELPFVERIEQFERFMRECQACQQDVQPHWQFCAHCGVRRSTACPGCGEALPPSGAESCPHCGLGIPRSNG